MWWLNLSLLALRSFVFALRGLFGELKEENADRTTDQLTLVLVSSTQFSFNMLLAFQTSVKLLFSVPSLPLP